MANYDLSVIVPAYNAEPYLDECLMHLTRQTIIDKIEIIVIDDGSSDSTGRIADKYAKECHSVKVYHQENKGLHATREIGLGMAQGIYIGWVDADDFVEDDMYEILLDIAKRDDADVVSCNYSFFPNKIATKEKWYKEYQGEVDWNFLERNTQPWNKIVKRTLIDDLNMGHWLNYCEDGAYALVLIKAKKICTCNRQLYHYRVGHVSMSTDYTNLKKFIKNEVVTERQVEALNSNNLENGWEEYYEYRVIYSILQLMLVAAFNDNVSIYKEMHSKLQSLNWRRNQFTKIILDNNHGKLKSFALRNLLPRNYAVARLLAKAVIR